MIELLMTKLAKKKMNDSAMLMYLRAAGTVEESRAARAETSHSLANQRARGLSRTSP